MQPAHDRGGDDVADTFVHRAGRTAGHLDHPCQPGDGLLDEDVTRLTDQTGRARPGHHLHRQDTVAAEVEEGLVDPDPFEPEYLSVDPGQDLFGQVLRRSERCVRKHRCRQSLPVDLAGGGHRDLL